MENLHLIVGLGNPGREYARTRHNAGFLAVEKLAERWRVSWTEKKKLSARVARADRNGRKLLLCQPRTWMNASGEAVRALVEYYQIPLTQTLMVVDDADLPLGEVRMRPSGSSGGHHGLESVEHHLGTRAYPRLRIGIGRTAAAEREITDYVLGPFNRGEQALVEEVLDRASDQIECWVNDGIGKAMSQFNGTVTI